MAERAVRRRGIEWEHNFYKEPGFARLRETYEGQKIKIKYDPEDKNVIYVPDKQALDGYVQWVSQDPDYTEGLSLYKHRLIRADVMRRKREVNREELAHSKKLIAERIQRDFYLANNTRKRSKLKRAIGELRAEGNDIDQTDETPEEDIPPTQIKPDFEEMNDDDDDAWGVSYDLPVSNE
jgi:putative transposase